MKLDYIRNDSQLFSVDNHMFCSCAKVKVFRAVIQFIPVDVMNYVIWTKNLPQNLLYHQTTKLNSAVLGLRVRRQVDKFVSLLNRHFSSEDRVLLSYLTTGVARVRTELLGLARNVAKWLTTSQTALRDLIALGQSLAFPRTKFSLTLNQSTRPSLSLFATNGTFTEYLFSHGLIISRN